MEITTIYGLRDDGDFRRVDGKFEDDNELTTWVEYWEDAEGKEPVIVHRSVHVHLKKPGPFAEAIAGAFA
jgi:hypothetical protein